MQNQTTTQRHVNDELGHFCGTENYYRHPFGFHYTDGIHYLAETHNCHWLIVDIAIANFPVIFSEFQVWKLQRTWKEEKPTDVFLLTCEDGNKEILFSKSIPFSDFDADSVEIWFANNVIYLPSEH